MAGKCTLRLVSVLADPVLGRPFTERKPRHTSHGSWLLQTLLLLLPCRSSPNRFVVFSIVYDFNGNSILLSDVSWAVTAFTAGLPLVYIATSPY
jgi:hypothetical protein